MLTTYKDIAFSYGQVWSEKNKKLKNKEDDPLKLKNGEDLEHC